MAEVLLLYLFCSFFLGLEEYRLWKEEEKIINGNTTSRHLMIMAKQFLVGKTKINQLAVIQ